jgi:diaminopimelate epimerase
MTTLKFTKMHGLGNDFVVIDAINQQVELNEKQIQFLADRHFGVGCDQLLLVETSKIEDVDFRYRIFNADGSEVQQCGNGVRCFARFVRDKGLTKKSTIAVETASGIVYPTIQQDETITVDMGLPHFEPAKIPFKVEEQATRYSLPLVQNEAVNIAAVSMGNPHAVMTVENVALADVERLGPLIEGHQQFPERVNAGFMQIISPEEIALRVYERGVGETMACGTGACAAVVSGIRQGLLATKVKVKLAGGELIISWPDVMSSVWMTGPATYVFDGEIEWATIHNY